MNKRHILTFDQSGNIKVDATGFTGKACAETTAKLLQGLGAETKREEKKPEYNLTESRSTSGLAQRW